MSWRGTRVRIRWSASPTRTEMGHNSLVTEVNSTALSIIYWVPNNVLQLRNPYLQTRGSRNPKVNFGIPSPARAHTFNPESRRDFALKSRIPSFNEGKTRIPKSLMGSIKLNQNIIIRYLALHIDCVLYVYLCNGLKFLEISESEYTKSKNIIHE